MLCETKVFSNSQFDNNIDNLTVKICVIEILDQPSVIIGQKQ